MAATPVDSFDGAQCRGSDRAEKYRDEHLIFACRSKIVRADAYLWRGGLPPLGCEAPLKPTIRIHLIHRMQWVYDCFAAERGQAPSPLEISLSCYLRAISELARYFSISSLPTQPKERVF
ncbi:hypothetical protein PspS34_25355 [Pseudomonas sp. S34]|nr:hypothetical protein PspS34_25355 [Pseudomonas sp. S34]